MTTSQPAEDQPEYIVENWVSRDDVYPPTGTPMSGDDITARVVVRGSDGTTRVVAGEVGALPAGVEYGPSECSCGADVCGHERTATPRRGVDRAALIEAATGAMPWKISYWDAVEVLDAVLPLVAQAIEDAPIPFTRDSDRMAWGHGVQCVLAMLVRSLAEEGEQQ